MIHQSHQSLGIPARHYLKREKHWEKQWNLQLLSTRQARKIVRFSLQMFCEMCLLAKGELASEVKVQPYIYCARGEPKMSVLLGNNDHAHMNFDHFCLVFTAASIRGLGRRCGCDH